MRRFAAFGGRRILPAVAVCLALGTTSASAQPAPQQSAGLKIVVIEGEDSVNLIDKKTAVMPTVEVRDRNDLPVSGAVVTFAVRGRAVAFNNGVRQLTVTTDSLGRAGVNSLTPISKGTVEIQVQASYQGQTAAATIHQANFANAAQAAQAGKVPAQGGQAASGGSTGTAATAAGAGAATGGGLSGAAIGGIVAGAAAAVGAGVAVANHSSSDNNTSGGGLNLTGTWTVQVTGTQSSGTGTFRLTQNGNSITGNDISPNPLLSGGGLPAGVTFTYTSNITGSVNGTSVPLTLVGNDSVSSTVPGVGTFTATCSFTVNMTLTAASSSSMSGTWTDTESCTSNPPNLGLPTTFTDGGRLTLTKQ